MSTPFIADADRVVEYNPVASTGPFPVTFPVFEETGADLYVTIDGVPATNWTAEAETIPGFYGAPNSFLLTLTFDVAITGALKIEGRRAPRRVSQYAEGRGVPARDQNTELNILTAIAREQHRRQNGIETNLGRIDAAVDAAEASAGSSANSAALSASDRAGAETARAGAETARDEAIVAVGFRDRKNVATLLADLSLEYGTGTQQVAAGDIIRTREEGYSYEVAASGASDHHVETASGVKLYVVIKGATLFLQQFGFGNGVDATTALQKMIAAAPAGSIMDATALTGTVDLTASPFAGIHTKAATLVTGRVTLRKDFNAGAIRLPSFLEWERHGTLVEPTVPITAIPGDNNPATGMVETWHKQGICTGSGTSYTLDDIGGVHIGSRLAIQGTSLQFQFSAFTLSAGITDTATSLTVAGAGTTISDQIGAGWVTLRIDDGANIEFVRGTMNSSGVLNMAVSPPESGRAKQGTTARAWSAGAQILVAMSSIRRVVAISGNTVTLDSAPDYAVAANTPFYVGSLNSALTGYGVVDGQYDRAAVPVNVWNCVGTTLSQGFRIAPGTSLRRGSHGGIFCVATRGLDVDLTEIALCGRPSTSIGASAWIFGSNTDGRLDVDRITDGAIALAVDDKSAGIGYYGLDQANTFMGGVIGSIRSHAVGVDITGSRDCAWRVGYSECSLFHAGLYNGAPQSAGVAPERSAITVDKMHTFRAPAGNAITSGTVIQEGKSGRDIRTTVSIGSPVAIGTQTTTSVNFGVTGAKLGDQITVNPQIGTTGIVVGDAYVSAADTLTVRWINAGTGTNILAQTLNVRAVGPW